MSDPSTSPGLLCSNCRDRRGHLRSPDMDIRPVRLCDVCAILLVIDPEAFDAEHVMADRKAARR